MTDDQNELDKIYSESKTKRFHELFRERSRRLITPEEEAEYQELLTWREEQIKRPGE